MFLQAAPWYQATLVWVSIWGPMESMELYEASISIDFVVILGISMAVLRGFYGKYVDSHKTLLTVGST